MLEQAPDNLLSTCKENNRMKKEQSIESLQKSVRRMRFGLVAMVAGVAILTLGAMTQEDDGMSVGPHLVGISAVNGTQPAQTALFRLWSNGRIDRRVVQTDRGGLTNSWEMVQQP